MPIHKLSRNSIRLALLVALFGAPASAQQANGGRPGVYNPPQAGTATNNTALLQNQNRGQVQPQQNAASNQTTNQFRNANGATANPAANGLQPANTQSGNAQSNNPSSAMQPGNNAAQQRIPIVPLDKAVAGGIANVVQQPFPALNDQEQKYIDTVLAVWENKTATIKTFECKFKRYVVEVAVDEKNPSTVSEGMIRFKNPDKGAFKEETRLTIAGKKPDGSPDYKVDPKHQFGDWWVCDGEWVHNLNRNEKKVVREQLPPEMRGNNIPLSPLPFLFGVKAAEVKARYFVRPLPAPAGNNDVWVEAWPKRADDAGNYSRVQIALDRSDSLPNAMIMFMPNWAPNNPDREVFNFTNREVNSSTLLDKIKENIFMKEFIETKGGNDWVVEETPWPPPQLQPAQPQLQQPSQSAPNNRVATPTTPPTQQPPRR